MTHRALLLLTLLTAVWSHGQDSISVLFIGNSYTYVNDLPEMTRQLALSNGKVLTVGSKTNGGYTFQNHCADPLTFAAMHQHAWDVVVLQAQSQEPSFPDEQVDTGTIPYAKQLCDSAYAINPCGSVLYYMTWGRENGDPQWGPISTFEGMNGRLYDAYLRMADSTNAMTAAVGAAWKYVRDHYPAVQLYSGDGSHPSLAGSYLAACVFYTSLFLEPVTGVSYTAGLDAQVAAQIQAAADIVVLNGVETFGLHAVDEPVQAHFTYVETGNAVQFTSTSTRAETLLWDFGDGTGSSEEAPAHTFPGNGPFSVVLMASNSCASDTLIAIVQLNSSSINELPAGTFRLLEFPDHFEIAALTKTIYFEIYTIDGKIITTGEILTGDFQRISKFSTTGIITLKNEQGQLFVLKFVNRI